MQGAHIACRLKYIRLCTHTHTNTQAEPPFAPHRQDLSACWIPDEHHPSSSPPPRGAAPLSPGSAAWHSARRLPLSCGQGNYPSFCVYVCKHWCVCFATECDAFTGTIFHICFLFWQQARQPTSQVAGWLAGLFSRRLLSKASSLQPADDYEKSSQRSDVTLRLLLSG